MRHKVPKSGDRRIVEKFLLFPVNINGERRWLERATIEQQYFMSMWINIEFKNK